MLFCSWLQKDKVTKMGVSGSLVRAPGRTHGCRMSGPENHPERTAALLLAVLQEGTKLLVLL